MNSDSSCNNKKSEKVDTYTGSKSLNDNIADQKKICHALESTQIDEKFPLPTSESNHFQKCVNDYSSDLAEHCLRNCSPKKNETSINKFKRENQKIEIFNKKADIQDQTTDSSMTIYEPTKFVNKYAFDIDTKNFKKDVNKLEIESEDVLIKPLDKQNFLHKNTKRSTSASNSPYKEKKRKCFFEKIENNHELLDQGTIHSDISPTPMQTAVVTKIYYSYFEQSNDDKDEIREIK